MVLLKKLNIFGLLLPKSMTSLKKTSHHFKMSNKHVFSKLIITHLHFPLSYPQTLDVKEFELVEVEYKNTMKANDIQQQSFTEKRLVK